MIKRYALVWTIAAAMAPATFAADAASDAQSGQSSQGQSQTPGAATPSSPQPGQSAGQSDQSAQSGAQTAGAKQAGSEQGQSQEATKECVQNLASTNQFEIQAGQLAQQRAQDPQIKKFADEMVKEHQQASEQLKPIAQAIGADISSTQLNAVHQAKLAELQKKQGEDFEKCYIFGQAGMHLANVLEASYRSQNASDPQLKQYFTQMQPKLQQHLQQALQASGEGARLASEKIPGSRSDRGASVTGDATGTGSGQSGQSGQGTSGASGTSSGGTSSGTGAGTGTQNP